MKFRLNICLILLICLVLSANILIFADGEGISNNNNFEADRQTMKNLSMVNYKYDDENKKDYTDRCREYKEHVETAITSLVAEGKLNKDKADKVLQYVRDKEKEIKGMTKEQIKELRSAKKEGPLKEMVSKGIIATEEADMIRTKLRELKEKRIDESINNLIKKGTITTSEAESIKNYLANFRKQKLEKFKQLENLSYEERKAYFKSYRKEKESLFIKMVEDGIITKTQSEELKKVLFNK